MTYDTFVDEEIATMWTSHEDYADENDDLLTTDEFVWLCTH